MHAYQGEPAMLNECAEHQIRVMLSSRLLTGALAPEYIETPRMREMLLRQV